MSIKSGNNKADLSKNENLAQSILTFIRSPKAEVKMKGLLAPMLEKFPSE
jgi:hypothetical protein